MPMQAQREGGDRARTHSQTSTRRWVVSYRSLDHRERRRTRCAEGWMDLEAGLDGYGKSRRNRNLILL